MDSITQAVLGAAVGEAILHKKVKTAGAIAGAMIATIPDLDIVLYPFYSSLERISIHRGFSHSILFSILGATLFMLILTRLKWFKNISKYRLWLFAWMALFTHILLDAFTTYGTQLLLPFSDKRISFDSINIVDITYTLPLAIGIILTIYFNRKGEDRPNFNHLGLLISSLYLLLTIAVKNHVENQFKKEFIEQNITYKKLLTVPVGMASINWYGVAKSDDGLYMGKFSDLKHNHITFDYFPTNDYLLDGLDPHLVDRLKWFAQDFYTVAENDGKIRVYNMQCDMQGVRHYGDYKAPTAFYFEIDPHENGKYELKTGMHPREE